MISNTLPVHIRMILLLSLLFPLETLANSDIELALGSEDVFLDDLPVILSATRLPQPLNEAPVAMTVIDREMIDASGARNIAELLRLAPGFQVGYFDGNTPVVTYHGHADEHSKRIQVLIDGRSVYVPSLAGIQWSDLIITVDEIDRIEVIRGPNSATFGNNAFLATISIITKQALEDHGHNFKVIAGSHATSNTRYSYGGQTDTTDYRITLAEQDNSGTDTLNDYTHDSHLSYRIDSQLNNNNQLSYQGGYKVSRYGDHESPPDFQTEAETAFQWIKLDHQTDDNNSLSVQYYYNYLNEDYEHENEFIVLGDSADPGTEAFVCGLIAQAADCFSVIDPFRPPAITIKSERHDIEFNYTYNTNNLRIVSGVSARLDIVQANNVFRSNDTLRHELYRLYSQGEYHFTDDWILNTGFMIENNDISGTDLAPRISLTHHLNENNSLRFGVSKATRTPTLYDQNAYNVTQTTLTENDGNTLNPGLQSLIGGTDILTLVDLTSNTNVDSEEITSMEIGYIAQLLDKRLLLDIKISKDKTDNLIGIAKDMPAPEDNFTGEADDIQNTHKTKIKSFELSADYKPFKDIRIFGHYAYIDIDAFMFNPDGHPRHAIRLGSSAPQNTYSLMLIKHWPENFNTSLMFYYSDEYDWLDRTRNRGDDHFLDRNVHSYSKVDVKFDKSYSFGKEKLNIALILQNIADDFYDYNRPQFTDSTLTTVIPTIDNEHNINKNGSLQDKKIYLEVSYLFN